MRYNNTSRLLLIGGGGHCRSVIGSLRKNVKYANIYIGVVDPSLHIGSKVDGCRVVGTDEDLQILYDQGYKEAFITVGSVKKTKKRRELYNMVTEIGFSLPTIIDKSSVISENIEMETGVYVGRGSIINSGCRIGISAIINTGVIIEHDCSIGAFSHIAVGAVVCGGVEIGDGVLVGANSTIIQGIKIGNGSVIGAGSTVIADIPENTLAVGLWGGRLIDNRSLYKCSLSIKETA